LSLWGWFLPGGGLLAFAHPVGVTSLLQTLFIYWELAGLIPKIPKKFGNETFQIPNAERSFITGHGGTDVKVGVIIFSR